MKDTLEIDIQILEKTFSVGLPAWVELEIRNHINKLKDRLSKLDNPKEERDFKNKDFHVKVWQDSEKIGIVTFWIREGFSSISNCDTVWFNRDRETRLYCSETLPNFGMKILTCEVFKAHSIYSYSDIVTELEKAHKLSSEVTIYDVMLTLDDTKNITDLFKELSKYEYKRIAPLECEWSSMKFVEIENIIDEPNDYKLRLKEQR